MTQQIQTETRMDKLKEDSTDCNGGFWKRFIYLTVFHSSFLLFATIDIVLIRQILVWKILKAVILSFSGNFSSFTGNEEV